MLSVLIILNVIIHDLNKLFNKGERERERGRERERKEIEIEREK